MKKHILTGFLLAMVALAAQAQQRMVLVMDDGTEKTYESWQVDRIYFKDAEVKVSVVHGFHLDRQFVCLTDCLRPTESCHASYHDRHSTSAVLERFSGRRPYCGNDNAEH